MERVWTTALSGHVGERVYLAGWMQRLRQLSSVNFLVLRDGQGTAQVVIEDPATMAQLADLQAESVLSVEGMVVATPQAPGGIEVRAERIEVLAPATVPPPFDLFRPTLKAQLPTILDHAALALRHSRHRALFRLSSLSMAGFRAALQARQFVEIQTPKLVGGATEGGANVFTVDYFGRPAFLSQSPQLYKQIMVGVFERVFEVGPAFRAEPHDTPRHLNEYVSLDVELGFIEDHTTVMELLGVVLAHMLASMQAEAADELALLGITIPTVQSPIPSIHFREALALYECETGQPAQQEPDLTGMHERWLGEWAQRTYGSDFLFVVGYPLATRAFYTHPDPDRPGYSRSFDLLFRGIELVSGSQRLHRYEDYLATFAARGMNPEPFAGYLEAFQHGMPPHGGFAIGLERWIAQLAGIPNVRTTTLFPRDQQRLTP